MNGNSECGIQNSELTPKKESRRLSMIRFIHLVRKGLTAREIAAKLNVSYWSVRDRARRYGMKIASARKIKDVPDLPFGVTRDDLDELRDDDDAVEVPA
jgi:repressor of nif and glnA expression